MQGIFPKLLLFYRVSLIGHVLMTSVSVVQKSLFPFTATLPE